MKILFFGKGQEMLSIEYLSAALKNAGHKVELLFDPGFDDNIGFINIPLLKKLFSEKMVIENIKKMSPDLIAFSCPWHLYPFVAETASLVKKRFNIPIVVGGGYPTIAPDHMIRNKDIDMICIGEGEEAIVELADKIEKGVDYFDTLNFWFKRNGEIIKNPPRVLLQNLDLLPFPDREIFHKFGCFAGNLYFIAGRGCPHKCSYCCEHAFERIYQGKGKYVRLRSVENVIEELGECVKKYNVKHIHSEDDLFAISHKWLAEFCEEYRKKIKVPFYCHVRPGSLTDEDLENLKSAGCNDIYFGIDAGNYEVRTNLLNRKIKDEAIYEQVKLVKKHGMRLSTSVMFGIPGETPEQMHETFKMIKEIGSYCVYVTVYYPFYNTELYNYAAEKGYLTQESIEGIMKGLGSVYRASFLENENNDLVLIFRNILPAYMRFSFLRPLIDLIIRKRFVGLSRLIDLFFTPFSYSTVGWFKIREAIKIFFVFLKIRLKNSFFKKY